ncbi:MAG: BON domain-containing protein [Dechloromonas sp.]|jgi:osmotically-inducible protein OsmY|uniref:BON domain-containing protein n=1 Tax=Candidatus Dechloromonas phosphorivorans TaxID=2899244 RepID=A0A935MQ60_9RHOO|nr:BON domain-containing protein [Candidatus Dechloromonas phosphorivorans]
MKKSSTTPMLRANQTTGKYRFRNTLIITMIATSLGLASASAETATTATENKQAVAETRQVLSDGWITTKVKSEILADSASKGYTVQVETTQGAVVLKGTLANETAVAQIKAIAEKVEGVRSVDTMALKLGRANK